MKRTMNALRLSRFSTSHHLSERLCSQRHIGLSRIPPWTSGMSRALLLTWTAVERREGELSKVAIAMSLRPISISPADAAGRHG